MPTPPTPQHDISGDSLRELIKAAKKLPTKPVGTICNLFRTTKASNGGDGYTYTMKIEDGLYVQCFGECKKAGQTCTLGIIVVRPEGEDPSIRISCNCFPPG
jgi:hypothetical protein